MGNCLETCRIRNDEIGGMSDVGQVEKSKDFHSVHVEDVLLKNPHIHGCMKKMEKEVKVKRMEAKKVRFFDKVHDDMINCKTEITREMSACTATTSATTSNENQSDPCNGVEGLKVRIVLTKEEAAALITLLKTGGGRKTMEELTGELARFRTSGSSHEKEDDDVENCWKPVLASIPEHEAV